MTADALAYVSVPIENASVTVDKAVLLVHIA
jgi:hypothetical protein